MKKSRTALNISLLLGDHSQELSLQCRWEKLENGIVDKWKCCLEKYFRRTLKSIRQKGQLWFEAEKIFGEVQSKYENLITCHSKRLFF